MKGFVNFIVWTLVIIVSFILFLVIYNGDGKTVAYLIIGYFAFVGFCEFIHDLIK